MLYGLQDNGERIKATPHAKAICSLCESPLIPKCGQVMTWHWAHKHLDCDPWASTETEWHLGWKSEIAQEFTEVVIERDGVKHRADIRTPSGMIVELQHSPLSLAQLEEREEFYDRMIWLFDVSKNGNLTFDAIHRGLLSPQPAPDLREFYYNSTIGGWLGFTDYDRTRIKDLVKLNWYRPSHYILNATKPVYLDFGTGQIVRVGKLFENGGWGYLGTAARFAEWLKTS